MPDQLCPMIRVLLIRVLLSHFLKVTSDPRGSETLVERAHLNLLLKFFFLNLFEQGQERAERER